MRERPSAAGSRSHDRARRPPTFRHVELVARSSGGRPARCWRRCRTSHGRRCSGRSSRVLITISPSPFSHLLDETVCSRSLSNARLPPHRRFTYITRNSQFSTVYLLATRARSMRHIAAPFIHFHISRHFCAAIRRVLGSACPRLDIRLYVPARSHSLGAS